MSKFMGTVIDVSAFESGAFRYVCDDKGCICDCQVYMGDELKKRLPSNIKILKSIYLPLEWGQFVFIPNFSKYGEVSNE